RFEAVGQVVEGEGIGAIAGALFDLGVSSPQFDVRVAKAIVAHRPITGTAHLAEVVTNAIPAATRRRGGHPAKRTFQALRIEVNQELEILPVALRAAIDLLAPGARLAVLSYHSGEDRIVKSVMREAESGGCTCPTGLPCGCGATPTVKRVRVRREATPAESARNPRAASARLRVVEKITEGGK
ncbi:MAG: 16S rRNA (cytosine(1402)-N(4))-methyltransferase, partial [Actinobacteria bacterium]|nr:16S rRNA (cytosine(1402)-N(4))-methyltransferase [Actinomycetota bacterium]